MPNNTVTADQLHDAIRRLRGFAPGRHIAVSFEVTVYPRSSLPEITWQVYDGRKHHEGPTLQAALAAAFAAFQPDPELKRNEQLDSDAEHINELSAVG